MVSKSRGPGPPSLPAWIFGMIAIANLIASVSSESNKRYDMQTLCEDRYRQQLYRKIEGAFLKSQNERNLDCIVTFQTHSILQRFMLRFDELQLDCNDHLFIYDGAHIVDSYKRMMLSVDNQRQSRSELQSLIWLMNKSKRFGLKRTPKFRFRAVVRTVINNLKWLSEEEMVQAEAGKGPKLTIQVKGLLRTNVGDRTPEDKSYLFKIIGNLSCLQRYPEKVRESLTSSSIFAYFGPGRVLVSEGCPSWNMYFILSGQAVVKKMMFDAGENQVKASEVATMHPGDSFGEADLSCRNTKSSVGVIFTHTNYVTLKYVTDNWGTESNGFRLVITAVKDPKHECKDFRCYQKEFCVHPELLCDGISHCADGSDESPNKCSQNDGGSILGISLPIFVVVLISLLLILSALGVIAGLIFCRNRHGMQQATPSHSQHPPHQVYSGTNGTSQIHVQKSTIVHGTTVITPMTVNWVHPVVRGYLVVWARLSCQAE